MLAMAEAIFAEERESVMAVPKRKRTRLAQSEIWLLLSCVTAVITDYSTPAEVIRIRYGLSEVDFKRLLERMADQLETKAMNCGYDDAWGVA